jgi:hypothetical protein
MDSFTELSLTEMKGVRGGWELSLPPKGSERFPPLSPRAVRRNEFTEAGEGGTVWPVGNVERQLEIAWAAGLFEGEGTIYRRSRGGAKLRLSMTDEEVVRKFADVFGIGVYRRCLAEGPNRAQWEAATELRAKIDEIVSLVGPFLSARRRAQVEQVLSLRPEWGVA